MLFEVFFVFQFINWFAPMAWTVTSALVGSLIFSLSLVPLLCYFLLRGKTSEKENIVTVKPTEDRVLVKPIEAETKTAAGIYLPETAKEKPVKGEVIATGPGKRLDNGKRAEMSVEVGDTVVYGKYAGTEVEIKGVKHLILKESELLGIIEG